VEFPGRTEPFRRGAAWAISGISPEFSPDITPNPHGFRLVPAGIDGIILRTCEHVARGFLAGMTVEEFNATFALRLPESGGRIRVPPLSIPGRGAAHFFGYNRR